MAINKVAGKPSKKHGGLRNLLEYVLRNEKVKEGYVAITGPYDAESINYNEVYRTWLREKRFWKKDTGRMYSHNIISFHKDEAVTPEQVLEIGKAFVDRFFPEHQSVIAVHQDKDHLHCHIITNTVSYVDGRKLHQTKNELQEQKDYTNELCRQQGLSVAEKGRHFDGSEIEKETILSWDKSKYKLLVDDEKKSYLVDLAVAIESARRESYNREAFILSMKEAGWDVNWTDSRKNITFVNQETEKKVRDTNISKTFTVDIGKEALERDFERKTELRQQLASAANSRGFASEAGRSTGQVKKAGLSHSRV